MISEIFIEKDALKEKLEQLVTILQSLGNNVERKKTITLSRKVIATIVVFISLILGIWIWRLGTFKRQSDAYLVEVQKEYNPLPKIKPLVFNTSFVADNTLMILSSSVAIEDNTKHTFVAEFIGDNGEVITTQTQDVIFDNYKNIQFIIPIDPRIKRARISYVKSN